MRSAELEEEALRAKAASFRRELEAAESARDKAVASQDIAIKVPPLSKYSWPLDKENHFHYNSSNLCG